MKYKTLCPDCGSVVEEGKYEVLHGYLGLYKKCHCPKCGVNFYVPQQKKDSKESK